MAALIPDVGSIADRLSGVFGKSYLLAGVLPIVLFCALGVIAGYDTWSPVRAMVESYQAQSDWRQYLDVAAAVGVAFILGFLFWSINTWLRLALQGDAFIPGWIRDWMLRAQRAEHQRQHAMVVGCGTEVYKLRRELPQSGQSSDPHSWTSQIRDARTRGSTHLPPNGSASSELRTAYKTLADSYAAKADLTYADLEAVFRLLVRDFATRQGAIRDETTEMDRIHVAFLDTIAGGTLSRLVARYERALGQFQARFPTDPSLVGPTRMSSVSQLCRDRSLQQYHLDPELIGLPLQRQAGADDKYHTALEDAKVKLDTAVGFTVVCGVSALIWAPVEGIRGSSTVLFLLLAVGLPLLMVAMYQTAIMSLRGFNDALWAAVQLYRLDALATMHIAPPADSAHERQLWDALARQSEPTPPTIAYKYTAP